MAEERGVDIPALVYEARPVVKLAPHVSGRAPPVDLTVLPKSRSAPGEDLCSGGSVRPGT